MKPPLLRLRGLRIEQGAHQCTWSAQVHEQATLDMLERLGGARRHVGAEDVDDQFLVGRSECVRKPPLKIGDEEHTLRGNLHPR